MFQLNQRRTNFAFVFVVQIFLGQVMGSSVGTQVFLNHGWRAAALVSLAWCAFCLFVMLIRGPNVKRYTWIGYEGGWELRKSRLEAMASATKGDDPSNSTIPDIRDAADNEKDPYDGSGDAEKGVPEETV